ncbi:MAG: serine/threonine protein kinase [Gemmatimonadales bacterium]|nr:MAG: serine/threonine protein kinase [Gemmatimonadales bacterium]
MDADRWVRIEALFHEALDLDEDQREAFLRDRCGDDDSLYREVASLLTADSQTRGMIGQAVGGAVDAMETEEFVGRSVGPWRIVRRIGHGGMGTVYLAERAQGEFEQRAALKLIRRGMDSEQILDRFRRERQILARLEHPEIARLLDGGLTDDGRPYFAMEFVEGRPIDQYCDEEGLGIGDRLRLFLKVCRAVAYAHRVLVVHRDLKPDNILVTTDGGVRLLDFGIAKVLEDEEGEDTLTRTAFRVMTPGHASPEQVRGEAVGTATDVYSLGLILYQLLSGLKPYEISSRSPLEIERTVCETEVERPSTRLRGADPTLAEAAASERGTDPRRLGNRLRGDLDMICLGALRKEPERRYGSVEALADDLSRHLEGLPVTVRPDTLGYRLATMVRRHRTGFAATLAVVLGVSVLTGVYVDRIAQERDLAQEEATKAAEVAGFLQDLFRVSDPSESRGETVTARELLDDGALRIASELEGQPAVQATMMRVIGEVYHVIGLPERAVAMLEDALEVQRALYGDWHAEVATTRIALGVVHQSRGDLVAADSLMREAVELRVTLLGETHPDVADALSNLAFLEETLGNETSAEALYRRTLAIQRTLYPDGGPGVTYSTVKLGGLLRRIGRHDEAEPLLREGLAAQRAHHGDLHPEVASSMRDLAGLLRDRGAHEEAVALYGEALAIRRALFGDEHPGVASVLNSRAILLERMGEMDRAIEDLREVVALRERLFPDPHPSLAAVVNNLAGMVRGREGVELYRRSMWIQDQVLPEGHPNRAFPRMGLASLHMELGEPEQAEPLLREALALRLDALDAGHRHTGETLSELGASLAAQGRLDEAEAFLQQAYDVLLQAEGVDGRRYQRARDRLASLHDG